MQLFDEYGDKLFASSIESDSINSSALTNLTYCQALLLLGIPEDERENFILQHDAKAMATRELAQVTSRPNNPQDFKIEYKTVVKKTDKPINSPRTAASEASITKYEERCAACCQTIADTFYDLLVALNQLAKLDPAVKENCIKDARRLAENMVKRLKEWPPVVKTDMKVDVHRL